MHGFTREELFTLAWEKPMLGQVEITDKCNQHCPFCYSGQQEGSGSKDLTLHEWEIIFGKLLNLGIRRIDFTGRESFMSSYFIDLVRFARDLKLEIRVNTNGTFDLSDVLPFVDEIIFSVHGLEDVHDALVGNPGSFKLIESNMERASEHGTRVSVNMSLVPQNFRQILQVFEHFDSRYSLCKFSPAVPVPSLYGTSFDPGFQVDRAFLTEYIDCLKKIPPKKLLLKHGFQSIFFSDKERYIDNGLLLPNCAAGKYKLIIENDGGVYPCNFFHSEEFYCGNMLTDDEKEIWKNGKGFQNFRRLILEEQIPDQCFSCFKKARCFSGCRAWSNAYQRGGFSYAKDARCDPGSAFIRG